MTDPWEDVREERKHTEILFNLIGRWQSGEVSNQVLIRDLNGMAMNMDSIQADADALLAVVKAAEICLPLLDTGQPKGERLQEALAALPEHLREEA